MLPFVVAFAAFSRPGVLPMRPFAVPLVSKTPANVKMAFEGPALVSAANVILAMNLMPLGPTAYGLGMGGKQMSAGQKNWGNRVRASCSPSANHPALANSSYAALHPYDRKPFRTTHPPFLQTRILAYKHSKQTHINTHANSTTQTHSPKSPSSLTLAAGGRELKTPPGWLLFSNSLALCVNGVFKCVDLVYFCSKHKKDPTIPSTHLRY